MICYTWNHRVGKRRCNSMATIICWHECSFLDVLKSKVNDPIAITRVNDLDKELKRNDINLIIILIELKWDGKRHTDFYGLEVAQRIRREFRHIAPIIFYSFLKDEYFLREEKLARKSQILNARGSYFIPLPFTDDELNRITKTAKSLSPATLIDVIEKCCDPIGTVIDKLHPLKSQINKITQEDFCKLKRELDKFLSQEQKEKLDFPKAIVTAEVKLSSNNYEGFRNEIQKLENNCIKLFNTTRENKQKNVSENRIPVLLIEDNIEICKNIKEELSKRNIEVNYFQSADDALNEIKNDSKNYYCVVIADWRLYERDSEKWQNHQGYEILEEIAKTHFFAPIALTSLNDSSIHEIRNNLSIKIDLFKKEHLINNNNWDIFTDILYQKYREIIELISNQPTGKEWNKSYVEKYRDLRVKNWSVTENEISSITDRLWKYYKNAIDNFKEAILDPLESHGIEINNIKNVLIVRRIWLSFWFQKAKVMELYESNEPIVGIYKILRQRTEQEIEAEINKKKLKITNIDQEIKKRLKQSAKTFANSLAIETSVLPQSGILPEEKAWLRKNGISLENQPEYVYEDDNENKTISLENESELSEPSDKEIQDAEKLFEKLQNENNIQITDDD